MANSGDRRIRSILIVGGGSAGWLSAAYLNRALGDTVRVTLIESSLQGTIGVGEATVPSLVETLRFIGMHEEDWMPKVNATFKNAVKYVNWCKPRDDRAHSFIHPFFPIEDDFVNPYEGAQYARGEFGKGIALTHFWLKRRLAGDLTPYEYVSSPSALLCDRKKSPRFKSHPEFEVRCAYHIDAGLLAVYLRNLSTSRGVEHVVDHIENVKLDERGFIQSVVTRGGRSLEADLFIDCSGFQGLLINKALGATFRSDRESLFCDAAVAFPVRHDPERDGLNPFTQATAQSSGWTWEIPLYHRKGCGYVYSTAFQTPAEAEKEALAYFGPAADTSQLRHIKIRTGSNDEPFKKNCVAIGLAASFIEPLESSGIFLIEYALGMLLGMFPDRDFAPALVRRYNDTVNANFIDTRDFVILHYVLANREDTPFWKAVHNTTVIPDALRERMEFGMQSMPMPKGGREHLVWNQRNWAAIFAGMGSVPEKPWPLLAHIDPHVADERFAKIKERSEYLANNLPDHYDYLKHLHYEGVASQADEWKSPLV